MPSLRRLDSGEAAPPLVGCVGAGGSNKRKIDVASSGGDAATAVESDRAAAAAATAFGPDQGPIAEASSGCGCGGEGGKGATTADGNRATTARRGGGAGGGVVSASNAAPSKPTTTTSTTRPEFLDLDGLLRGGGSRANNPAGGGGARLHPNSAAAKSAKAAAVAAAAGIGGGGGGGGSRPIPRKKKKVMSPRCRTRQAPVGGVLGSMFNTTDVPRRRNHPPAVVSKGGGDARRPPAGVVADAAGCDNVAKPPRKKRAKRDPNAPRWPMPMFAIYQNAMRPSVKLEHPNASFGEVAKIMAAAWRVMTEDEKRPYFEMHAEERARYRREMEGYNERRLRREGDATQGANGGGGSCGGSAETDAGANAAEAKVEGFDNDGDGSRRDGVETVEDDADSQESLPFSQQSRSVTVPIIVGCGGLPPQELVPSKPSVASAMETEDDDNSSSSDEETGVVSALGERKEVGSTSANAAAAVASNRVAKEKENVANVDVEIAVAKTVTAKDSVRIRNALAASTCVGNDGENSISNVEGTRKVSTAFGGFGERMMAMSQAVTKRGKSLVKNALTKKQKQSPVARPASSAKASDEIMAELEAMKDSVARKLPQASQNDDDLSTASSSSCESICAKCLLSPAKAPVAKGTSTKQPVDAPDEQGDVGKGSADQTDARRETEDDQITPKVDVFLRNRCDEKVADGSEEAMAQADDDESEDHTAAKIDAFLRNRCCVNSSEEAKVEMSEDEEEDVASLDDVSAEGGLVIAAVRDGETQEFFFHEENTQTVSNLSRRGKGVESPMEAKPGGASLPTICYTKVELIPIDKLEAKRLLKQKGIRCQEPRYLVRGSDEVYNAPRKTITLQMMWNRESPSLPSPSTAALGRRSTTGILWNAISRNLCDVSLAVEEGGGSSTAVATVTMRRPAAEHAVCLNASEQNAPAGEKICLKDGDVISLYGPTGFAYSVSITDSS